jgi:8-oxo-dGTP diphosphatase
VYEAVWGGPIHRPDFRRKVLGTNGFLEPIGQSRPDQLGGPPAYLYRLGPSTLLDRPMVRISLLTEKEN